MSELVSEVEWWFPVITRFEVVRSCSCCFDDTTLLTWTEGCDAGLHGSVWGALLTTVPPMDNMTLRLFYDVCMETNKQTNKRRVFSYGVLHLLEKVGGYTNIQINLPHS